MTTPRPRRLRRRSRGFSLLEILVVMAIIALLAGAVAIGVVKHLETARVTTTRQSALAIRTAAASYRMQHADATCPTMEDLVQDQAIDEASRTKDPWDQPFKITCDERGSIRVVSGGPDKKPGTPDDVVVPDPAR